MTTTTAAARRPSLATAQPVSDAVTTPPAQTGFSKVVASAEAAIADIAPGSVLLVGGFGLCGIPEKLIGALKDRPHVSGLTVVSNNAGTADWGLGLLMQTGQIKRMIASYVGDNKLFERLYLTGALEVELTPQGTLAERCRAGGAGIPAFFTPAGVGTAVEHGGMPIKYGADGTPIEVSTPREARTFNGRPYLMERAITGDYALIKGWKADALGNVVFRGSAQNFNTSMAKAAATCIVEVEEIVPVGALPPDQIHLPSVYVHRVVHGHAYEKRIERVTVRDPAQGGRLQSYRARPDAELAKRLRIVRRGALEFTNGMYCNLGIGLPVMASNYIEPGIHVFLQSENGILGLGPFPTPDRIDADNVNAGKQTVTLVDGACTFESAESFGMIRGGHLAMSVLGALQVSETGDLANYMIPRSMVKGPGGAMDLVAKGSPTRVVVLTEHVSKHGKPKLVKQCDLPLTGIACVNRIITDMAVFDVEPGVGLTLIEIAPDTTLDAVRAATEAAFTVSPQLTTMRQSSVAES
ncbi:hypothetical protein CXG81DRAFT_8897 [Caulochytrium protostelioides]|uniref:Succinyl-CoA:3-ketoacid-coenzyme A transferase n=1 Tax=Caulochytrium protostelioides TaxID=1555241 RepID=A0A4P9XEH7_9FUNG|nr:hypothetical protein CXG81DRAFT_8897 [Caulochytrium protostelioides]|eukprot:RKP03912.1 hypothetical protein CXG81DRAFT_8897 [Caulochytrium protostelioides]